MEKMRLGNSDIQVSKVALGTIAYGSSVKFQPKEVEKLLDCCLDNGIDFVDTAPVYGTSASEILLGESMGKRREKFVLQTKCGLNWRDTEGPLEYVRDGRNVYRNFTPQAIRQDLEDSLKRLKTDYIDVYVTHRQPTEMVFGEIVDTLEKLIQEGKIRSYGISNATVDEAREYFKHGSPAVIQQKYSIVVPQYGNLFFPVCKEYGMTYQTWGSLEGGALVSRESVESITGPDDPRAARSIMYNMNMKPYSLKIFDALEAVAEKHGISVPNVVSIYTAQLFENINMLTGAIEEEHIISLSKAFSTKLTQEDLIQIDTAVKAFHDNCLPEYIRKFPVNESQGQ